MARFIVRGQGILVFKPNTTFHLFNEDCTDGLFISNETSSCKVYRILNNELLIEKQGVLLTWFSLDAQNQCVYAGNGEARVETSVYRYQFEKADKPFLESIVKISSPPEKIIKDPITRSVPLIVKNTCTMHEIAHNKYMPKSHLSLSSQRLYDCIYKTTLNTPDFKDFAKAIDYSIVTPGCWCHEKLKEKASEFGKPNINETYLRITLGSNNGESPGIPYVMEIWPVNHYSPVHSHGDSDAIIHVLRGKISVSLYPSLQSPTPFGITEFKKGDITWISPSLNQTHKLENKGSKTCVTLQCYTYTDTDTKHYDYFDYIEDSGEIKQYTPDSDMDYIDFKKQMQTEWADVGLLKKLKIH
jgi:uncharacterized cupin superfamily protein